MMYDLVAMCFGVDAARKGNLECAFWWDETLEGFDYWQMVWAGDIPEAEWRPKVDAMIAQWEAEKN